MKNNESERYCPADQKSWRSWLEINHISRDFVWLVVYKVSSGKQNITWSEAVEESLCFGWIDSTKRTLDEDRYIQYFSKRKPKSTWSRINKELVKNLIQENRMVEAGIKCITTAKQNGSWTILDQVENLIIPDDLAAAFKVRSGAKESFLSLSKSRRKILLAWIVMAKRKETREKRVRSVATSAEEGTVPPNFIR